MTHCRFCKQSLIHEFMDLASAPPSNSFLKLEQLDLPEVYLPLKLFVCHECFLVQVNEHKAAGEIFNSDYIYFSSYSKSWLDHCQRYVDEVTERFTLSASSKVVELASNDGYLLQFFKGKGIPVLGIEPTKSTAEVAIKKGLPTQIRFFGQGCARDLTAEKNEADLIVANNVLAHVPDINDFVRGIKILLKKSGVATAEFPHLMQMVEQRQFDTIYHEHFSYFSFTTICRIFREHGLRIFDVEELPTHGGSLRIYADHGAAHPLEKAVDMLITKERDKGMGQLAFYSGLQEATNQIKYKFVTFLIQSRTAGRKVVGYGAAAKGNTILNYCGVKQDLLDFVVDASPHKQGRYLPGSRIPVVSEASLREARPDFVVILPWNLKSEITHQLAYIREWGGKFVTVIPQFEIY